MSSMRTTPIFQPIGAMMLNSTMIRTVNAGLTGDERDDVRRQGGDQDEQRQQRPEHGVARPEHGHERTADGEPHRGPGECTQHRRSPVESAFDRRTDSAPSPIQNEICASTTRDSRTARASPAAPRMLFCNHTPCRSS